MKKLFLATALSLYSTLAFAGYGQDGKIYTKFDLGYGVQDIKQNITGGISSTTQGDGVIGFVGLGYYMLDEMRVEGSFFYDRGLRSKANATSAASEKLIVRGKERTIAAYATVYYDFLNTSNITPYISGGIGYMRNEFEAKISNLTTASESKAKKGRFTYGYLAGLGVAYHVASSLDIDFSYRYMQSSDSEYKMLDDTFGLNIVAKGGPVHAGTIGIRNTF